MVDPSRNYVKLLLLICLLVVSGCHRQTRVVSRKPAVPPTATIEPLPDNAPLQLKQMLQGAIAQTGVTVGRRGSCISQSRYRSSERDS